MGDGLRGLRAYYIETDRMVDCARSFSSKVILLSCAKATEPKQYAPSA